MVVPVVLAVAFAASAGAASAQTVTAFQATVKSVDPMGNPTTSCTHSWCGTAKVAGYGAATWTFDALTLTSYGDPTSQCATYTGIGEFVLNDGGGTLSYSEGGNVCTPGHSVTAVRKGNALFFNAPWTDVTGPWMVTGGTGDFAGVVSGSSSSGSDSAKLIGPGARGTYTGTLTTS
jgi:hypothetical protein